MEEVVELEPLVEESMVVEAIPKPALETEEIPNLVHEVGYFIYLSLTGFDK